MSFFKRIFKRDIHNEIASRNPIGKFRVKKELKSGEKQALLGEVLEGVIYPGYKLKGDGVALVRRLKQGDKEIDFAVEYDEVVILLEGKIRVKENDILEVYQS
ncbi:hypothetical protein PAP_01475 [Palaeococcus pacificus DY20341]|uniref:Elongation factor Tu-type domain-containing protein n=1 Tax=Palaeococcus pacificus DY20341 TaxID=1343739 RepID=A0A075LPX0_9EURY|nr:tRNA-binding protein Pbp11 [Palaeococcus pacificus]AIF68735.1 hypothetical protein PAP_01475 [Palaeococcus pacificus DY20341]